MPTKPRIVCLCGSTRFPDAFALANMHLTLQGVIVISVGMLGHADQPAGARFLCSDGDESTAEKVALDQLHFRKIDLSDGIFVVNVGGYIGSSTRREIAYAEAHGKTVEYLFVVLHGGSASPMTPRAGDATQAAKDGQLGSPSDSGPPQPSSPFQVPLMHCPDCGATFRADEYHDTYCGFPGHGRLARWWKRHRVVGGVGGTTKQEETR